MSTEFSTHASAQLSSTSYLVLGLLAREGASTPYDLKRHVAATIGFWSFPRALLYDRQCLDLRDLVNRPGGSCPLGTLPNDSKQAAQRVAAAARLSRGRDYRVVQMLMPFNAQCRFVDRRGSKERT